MKRVMITGGPGSGKSTLAIKLADKSGLPLYHMDHIHYRPGWDPRSNEEKDILTHEIHMKDQRRQHPSPFSGSTSRSNNPSLYF